MVLSFELIQVFIYVFDNPLALKSPQISGGWPIGLTLGWTFRILLCLINRAVRLLLLNCLNLEGCKTVVVVFFATCCPIKCAKGSTDPPFLLILLAVEVHLSVWVDFSVNRFLFRHDLHDWCRNYGRVALIFEYRFLLQLLVLLFNNRVLFVRDLRLLDWLMLL